MKITNQMVEVAYAVAKEVYGSELTRVEGKEKNNRQTGMKIGSANDYVTVFLDMMSGSEYHRTINNYATAYYFENIELDYGEKYLEKAVNATDMHTKYYGTLGKGYLRGIEKIVKQYKEYIRKG